VTQGGDTDTNAAIAGAIAGTYFGKNNLMNEPITYENIDILINANYAGGDIPIANEYHPKVIFELFKV
jgi:hypothetical protein